MDADDDSSADNNRPHLEPVRRHQADVPAQSQHFFEAAPALAVHDGPWTYSRRPRLGAAFKISALVAGVLVVALVVLDQVRSETLLEGDLVAAGVALAFLVVVVIGSPGISLSRGKVRYLPSGRKLATHSEEYLGSVAKASVVHESLGQNHITHREIQAMSQTGHSEGRLVVSVYWSKRDDVAFATVHFKSADDEFLIWPPVQISRDRVAGLTSSEPASFDVSASTQ